MDAIICESKKMSFSGPTKSRHQLATSFGIESGWCVDKGSSVELSVFGGDRRWSRRGDVGQLSTGSFVL